MPKIRTHTMPVIMYPEGVIVGKVRTGKTSPTSKVRCVAFDTNGHRIGTFDTYTEAKNVLIELARNK
jgi:hypothetical protein